MGQCELGTREFQVLVEKIFYLRSTSDKGMLLVITISYKI